MSLLQRLMLRILPQRAAQNMERDSRAWKARCRCGFTRSVWEMGGIRWKAAGKPRWYLRCPQCGKRSWHTVERGEA